MGGKTHFLLDEILSQLMNIGLCGINLGFCGINVGFAEST
jgi:hypothetical protein